MLLSSIELENILSFKHVKLDLRPLNVLIGANASGKSNLIRVLGLVRALPRDMGSEIASLGGVAEWINKRTNPGTARLRLTLKPGTEDRVSFKYSLGFRATGATYEIVEETLASGFRREEDQVVTGLIGGQPIKLSPSRTVLSEIHHPSEPLIWEAAEDLQSIQLYREFRTGPRTQAREGSPAVELGDHLREDGGNLALVLNELNVHDRLRAINSQLERFWDQFSQVGIQIKQGSAQLYIREKGTDARIAAAGLSDGTLRLLCLLAVLLDPDPPKVVCIEEPEIGLHPDAIRIVAELLVEASARMQLIVTTHSPALIDALSPEPESVIVCERDVDGFTKFCRLKKKDLELWLDEYSLGDLWQKGEIGGNRW